MANPLKGVYLNNRYYNFVPGSYSMDIATKNNVVTTQNTRTAQYKGLDLRSHALTIQLDNTYFVFDAATNNISSGATTWIGISRLADMESYLNTTGDSQPLTFIAPDGCTHLVIATGSLRISQFIPDAPESAGVEYRVNLTLENVQ